MELGPAADSQTKEFFDQVELIRDGTKKVTINAVELDKIHRQAMTVVTPEDVALYTKKGEILMIETNRTANSVRKLLKDMDRANRDLMATMPIGSADVRMRNSQHSQLTKRFVEAMNSYQNVQVTYKAKRPQASSDELEKLCDTEEGQQMLSQVFSMSAKADARKTLAELQERHQDIMMIEKSIVELHQLFVDMSVLVEQQGDLIDQIENHVGQAASYTGQAAVELQQAVKYQKSALRKKWILISFVLLILLAVGIFAGITISNSSRN
jgi:t-SNARE complex subunit (syntaxin)